MLQDIYRVFDHFVNTRRYMSNPFSTNIPLLYPKETSQKRMFSDVFKGIEVKR